MTDSANGYILSQRNEPIQMYSLERLHEKWPPKTPDFNAVHVVRYWLRLPKPASKEVNIQYINTFPIRNFFRRLFGMQTKRPWKSKFYNHPEIEIEFSNYHFPKSYVFPSNRVAIEQFEKLDKFMKNVKV